MSGYRFIAEAICKQMNLRAYGIKKCGTYCRFGICASVYICMRLQTNAVH